MSRPATAAQSNSRTQPVGNRARRRRRVSATVPGMLGLFGPGALRDQQPGQLPDEEWVAAAAPPQLRAHLLRRCASRQWPRPSPRLPLGRGRPGPDGVRRRAGRATPAVPRCRGTHRPAAPCCRSARGPGIPAAARTARPPSAGRPARPAGAGRRRARRGSAATDSNTRNCASAAAPASMIVGVAAIRSAAAGRRPRVRRPAGRSPAGPATTASTAARRCPPNTDRAGPCSPGPRRSISAASTAVLPMPASPLISRNCPVPATASRSTEPAAASTASRPTSRSAGLIVAMMTGQGRSSKIRFIGACDPQPADPGEPGLGGQLPQAFLTGLRAERLGRRRRPSGRPRSVCTPMSRRRRTCGPSG